MDVIGHSGKVAVLQAHRASIPGKPATVGKAAHPAEQDASKWSRWRQTGAKMDRPQTSG